MVEKTTAVIIGVVGFGVGFVGGVLIAFVLEASGSTARAPNAPGQLADPTAQPEPDAATLSEKLRKSESEVARLAADLDKSTNALKNSMNALQNAPKITDIEETLQGIDELSVVVVIADTAKAIDTNTVQAKAELALRRNRVPLSNTLAHRLMISVDGMWDATNTSYTYAVHAQFASLTLVPWRRGFAWGPAVTWTTGSIGRASKHNLNGELTDAVTEAAEAFANVYLKMNPNKD